MCRPNMGEVRPCVDLVWERRAMYRPIAGEEGPCVDLIWVR